MCAFIPRCSPHCLVLPGAEVQFADSEHVYASVEHLLFNCQASSPWWSSYGLPNPLLFPNGASVLINVSVLSVNPQLSRASCSAQAKVMQLLG